MIKEFEYKLNANKTKEYLQFIYEWSGLRYLENIPKSYKEYKNKARNWLNHRRRKVYNNTMFADMIRESIKVKCTLYLLCYL